MRIERIVKKDENNGIVYLDNGEKLFLSFEIIMKNGLRKNDEISEGRFSLLVNENQKYHIKHAAFRFLARRPHSAKELAIKLRQKRYDDKLITAIVDELKEKNFLDDYEFAKAFYEEKSNLKKMGEQKIKAELIKRGVSSEIISRVFLEEFDADREKDNARILAEKKMKSLLKFKDDKNKLRQKLYSYLSTRGFDYEIIRQVIDEFIESH